MKKIDFADCIESFFSTYLVGQRNASPATVSSYSDALTLLVRFIEQETGKSPEKQDLSDLSSYCFLSKTTRYFAFSGSLGICTQQLDSNEKYPVDVHQNFFPPYCLSISEHLAALFTNLNNSM